MCKNDLLLYIKNFSKIKISAICRKLFIDRSNLLNGRTSEENLIKVKEEIESEIAKLYIKGE